MERKDLKVNTDDFCKTWSGVALLVETSNLSIEPDYKEHKRNELFLSGQKLLLYFFICLLGILFFIRNNPYDMGRLLFTAVNLAGIYVGYLLVLKQMHIQGSYADKICSLFRKSDCNDVLESAAAKIGGVLGWIEIGIGYFLTNLFIAIAIPPLLPYVAVINIFALPYSFWSIWYQKVKVKQWCPLCLLVQVLVWIIFLVDAGSGFIRFSDLGITNFLIVGLLYMIPIFSINLLMPKLIESNRTSQIAQELNSIKANEDVFSAMLKQQPHYEVNRESSNILWGNLSGTVLVTILTNPHCNPCAKIHKRINVLLKQTNHLCVQYIFSSFSKELDDSNKFLMAIYFNRSDLDRKRIYDEWFEGGMFKREGFFERYEVNVKGNMVINEFGKHETWKEQTKLHATPTILVNGYVLPNNYKIEDLRYIKSI